MCIRDKIFTIRGLDNCIERSYQKIGFFEVDTGEETDWTVSLVRRKDHAGSVAGVRRNRKVKIVATLGPASASPEMIEKLFLAGVDVFRINMSHTQHKLLAELHGHIRKIEIKLNRPIGILADLQGPKIRIGTFRGRRSQDRGRRPVRLRSRCGTWRCEPRSPAASGNLRRRQSRATIFS